MRAAGRGCIIRAALNSRKKLFAVQKGSVYHPAEGQRPVNWDQVESWANRVKEPDFAWKSESEMGSDEYIIVGENNAIASGQHRILGGLMGGNSVPEAATSRIGAPLPTQPW